MWTCKMCETHNEDQQMYCGACGMAKQDPPQKTRYRTDNGVNLFGIAVLTIFIIVGILFVVGHQEKKIAATTDTTQASGSVSSNSARNTTSTLQPILTFSASAASGAQRDHVRLTWRDSRNAAPYSIAVYSEKGTRRRYSYTIDSNVQGTSYMIQSLIPGETYRFTVTAKDGRETSVRYTLPAADIFVDDTLKASSIKLSTHLSGYARAESDVRAKQNKSGAAEIKNKMSDMQYGFYFKIDYPKLKRNRTYDIKFALYMPDGSLYDTFIPEMTLDDKYDWWRWYCLFGYALDHDYELNGNIQAGDYTIKVFFEGMYVGSQTVTIMP